MAFTDVDATNHFLEQAFPRVGVRPRVTDMTDGRCFIAFQAEAQHMRPGDIVSGPTQMTLVDTAGYVCVFTRLGLTPMAVTSSLHVDFLRACQGKAVTAEAELVKIGRVLAVVSVSVRGADGRESARASVTYALPQEAVT
jgi:uncharacterized protein (TIGR00369 family)